MVKIMTTKQYLQQIYRLYAQIKQRQEQLDELKAAAAGFRAIDYSADKVRSSPTDRMADVVGRYADLEAEMQELIDAFFVKKNLIISQIQSLEDPRYADVLYARYVSFEPFRKIARDLHYDYDYCCRLHGRALKAFEQAYLKEEDSK